jgi:hypothetical protein
MTIGASITHEVSGLKVEATLIAVTRGTGATVTYAVTVWAVNGKFSTVIPGGEAMLPPEMIQNIKLKLWESIKP